MDILFVIDKSESMVDDQAELIQSFPEFIGVLDAYRNPNGDPVEYRVGVTSSSVNRTWTWNPPGLPAPPVAVGDDGALLGAEECALASPWIDGPGADAAEGFGCTADLGPNGSAYEMPFAAIELALGAKSGPGGPNDGFYRREQQSLLVIVIITDEDDCSIEQGGVMGWPGTFDRTCKEATSTGLYTAEGTKGFLDTVAQGELRYMVVGIGPESEQTCGLKDGTKRAARIIELVELSHYGVFGDICQGDLAEHLETALEEIKLSCDELPPVVI
jgi:hypothetical protein